MNIGKLGWRSTAASNAYTEPSQKHTSNNPLSLEIMKGKKQTLYQVKIQLISYDVDSENYEKINSESWETFTGNLTEGLLSFMIQKETQVNPFYAGIFTNGISDFMYRQLSEIHKELSNTSPVVIEDKELSLLIFHAAADGLMNYMRGSKQSRMDWFTTPDIVPKCGTSGE